MAHRGVLFLDEFPEFPRHVLESLRQPMEDGFVQISRASGTMVFPSKFILVAASNPCPCGYLGSLKKACTCLPGQVIRYRKKVSGPLLDRIDIHLAVPEVKIKKLTKEMENRSKTNKNLLKTKRETSQQIQVRVEKARQIQLKRFKKFKLKIVSNNEMNNKQVKNLCFLDADCLALLHRAMAKLNLSARAYFRIIKVAQTIADLAQENKIRPGFIAEAIQYRPREEE